MKTVFSRISLILIVVCIVFSNSLIGQDQTLDRGYIVKVGDVVPEINLPMTSGETISLSELKGKVIVLQFTASWCSVCRKEMPHLEKDIWLKYKDKDFVLIGVDIDEDESKVAPFIKTTQVTYPIALDSNKEIFHKFARPKAGVTRNIVIDQTGEIAFLTRLFDPVEFEAMASKINQLLK